MVFRCVNGKTVMSRRPRKPDPSKQSKSQKQTRSQFKLATAWAKQILSVPEEKAYYSQLAKQWGLSNARIAAIKDFMRNKSIRRQFIGIAATSRHNANPEGDSSEIRRPERQREKPEPHLDSALRDHLSILQNSLETRIVSERSRERLRNLSRDESLPLRYGGPGSFLHSHKYVTLFIKGDVVINLRNSSHSVVIHQT